MSPDIRRIREDELPAFVDAMSTAFLERPDVAKIAEELRPLWDLERVWAAFEGECIRGTFRSWATELTVPGGARLPATAITGVTVLPTHRRRGFLRQMTAAEHGAARDRGDALGLLYAAEYPIYGRFGYGSACREATWTLDASATAFHGGTTGSVEIERPSPETRDTIKGVFEAWRLRQPGEIRRRDFIWDFDLGLRTSAWGDDWKGFLVVHRGSDGTTDGYARYHAESKWEQRQPRNALIVDELHGLTDDAYTALWRYAAEIDWVSSVKAARRLPDERLPWLLTNARAASVSEVGDGLWVRLLDVPRALESRTYAQPGTVVLEVADAEAPGGRLRVELEAGVDGSICRMTTRSPDLSLDVSALGAAYLGGTRMRDAVLTTGVDEHRTGALAATESLFRTADEPWCSTFF